MTASHPQYFIVIDSISPHSNSQLLTAIHCDEPNTGFEPRLISAHFFARWSGWRLLYNKHNRSYFEALEVKAERMAKKYDCAFVDNEMPYGRVPQGHPVIVDYFYHEEIRGTENTGKRNR